ncbi:MAG: AmmeMemoRadiSam system protein A [Armatimonadota bacterium]
MMFSPEQQRFLLQLARQSVAAAVTDGKLLTISEVDDVFRPELGVFVTLTKFGQLRGCIGFPEPALPLFQAVIHSAASAALQDPRFPAVAPVELDDLHIEISVLSPLQPATAEEVEVGMHGLVIEHGRARGLLLPQVPVEWGWNRDEFLAHTCRKAGLHADAWREGASLFTFTAEVFSEEMLREEAGA